MAQNHKSTFIFNNLPPDAQDLILKYRQLTTHQKQQFQRIATRLQSGQSTTHALLAEKLGYIIPLERQHEKQHRLRRVK